MYAIQVIHENDGPRLIGSVLRARPLAEKLAIVRRFRAQFWPHVESGAIRPVIDRSFPVQEAQAAHEYMRGYGNIGKIGNAVPPRLTEIFARTLRSDILHHWGGKRCRNAALCFLLSPLRERE